MKEYIMSLSKNLKYNYYELIDDTYYVYCETKTKKYKHPNDDIYSKSIKDKRIRKLDDISFNGKKVKIIVKMKVFTFKHKDGTKEFITERLDFVSDLYKKSQRTERLEKYILDIANNGSAISVEQSLRRNGIKISDTTINRMIKKKKRNENRYRKYKVLSCR